MFEFIKKFLSLPARVEALEERQITNKLEIKSPDGKRMITLLAEDDAAGIWITKEDTVAGPCLYHQKIEGAVVGVRGEDGKDGLNIALAVPESDGEATIQIIDKDKKIHHFKAQDLAG